MLKNLIGESWYNALSEDERACLEEKYLITEKKRETQEILPYEAEQSGIYQALKLTPFEDVKVLIMGQDPYPNKEDAHGLAFSKLSGNIPASLKNIFEKIKEDTGVNVSGVNASGVNASGVNISGVNASSAKKQVVNVSGNLTPWAKQGVLLLNRALTFSKSETLAIRNKFWLPVIDIIINKLLKREKPLVIILWGNPANDIEQFSFEKEEEYKKHNIYILRSSHPSNMGNAKNSELKDGKIPAFTASPTFRRTNEILKSLGQLEVSWQT